jgi:hypothetical protein
LTHVHANLSVPHWRGTVTTHSDPHTNECMFYTTSKMTYSTSALGVVLTSWFLLAVKR